MSVNLPDVTLVALDCVAHDLTRLAIDDTLKQITPGDVQIWSDKVFYRGAGATHTYVELNTMRLVEECLWYWVPYKIETSHFLLIQYDGWVTHGDKWCNNWLNCDFIGAPWWYKTLNVGNGGFSLRSASLARFVANNKDVYPLYSPEDQTLCRDYRKRLAQQKFYWASEYEASRFAFEREGPWDTFGFHGIFNWHKVCDPDQLQLRLTLANDYVRSKIEWKELNLVPIGESQWHPSPKSSAVRPPPSQSPT